MKGGALDWALASPCAARASAPTNRTPIRLRPGSWMLRAAVMALGLFIVLVAVAASEPAPLPAQIFTEPHDAAVGAIMTTNFVAGRGPFECHEILGKPAEWARGVQESWQQRNSTYFQAASQYIDRRVAEVERTAGFAAAMQLRHQISEVASRNGAAAVADRFVKGKDEGACKRLVADIESGRNDISPEYPLFKEITEVVGLMNAVPASGADGR